MATGTLGPTLLVDADTGPDPLVVKLITTVHGDDATALAEALAERAADPVMHPGLLPILAAGVDPAGVYVVSAYVDAPTLDTRLRGGRQPLPRVLDWLGSPAAGLHAAHQQARLHGAVHPRDVLLLRTHGVLTGLDISPALEALGLQAPVRVPLTAPERASGKAWDAQADQYSLAMLALDALSGRRLIAGTIPAFDRWTLADTPGEDARLHEVFARALHPDPDRRFASMAEWLEALAGAADAPSELSRFARDGVIMSSIASEVRREPNTDSTDSLESASPLALFPEEHATPPPPPSPGGRGAGQSPTGEWLVASVPDDALTDTPPPRPRLVDAEEGPGAPPPPPVDDDDFALRAAADDDEAPDAAGDGPVHWQEPVGSGDGTRRTAAMIVVVLLVVGAVAFGTWRSLRQPGGADSAGAPVSQARSSEEVDAGSQAGGADSGMPVDAPRSAPPAVAVEEEALRPSAEELRPGLPASSSADSSAPQAASSASRAPEAPPAAPPARPAPATRPVPESAGAAAGTVAPGAAAITGAGQTEAPLSLDLARVLIRSSPSGAVRVNGRPRGQTPVVLRDLPFGSYVITITRPGYVDAVREIDVMPSQPVASLAIDLVRQPAASAAATDTPAASPGGPPEAPARAPAPRRPTSPPASQAPGATPPSAAPMGVGSVYIVSRPADARLFVDGQMYGTTPAVVPGLRAGRHLIRIEAPGYRTWTTSIEVQPDQRVRVDASLLQEPR